MTTDENRIRAICRGKAGRQSFEIRLPIIYLKGSSFVSLLFIIIRWSRVTLSQPYPGPTCTRVKWPKALVHLDMKGRFRALCELGIKQPKASQIPSFKKPVICYMLINVYAILLTTSQRRCSEPRFHREPIL